MTIAAQFIVGKSYSCRSICNSDCVWFYVIASRTAKTIATKCGKVFRINAKLSGYRNAEAVYPMGQYSMCPVLSSEKVG